MNEHDDVICQVRESFAGLRMDTRVEDVFARSRARRRRRLSGLTATAAAAAAAAVALILGGPAPAGSGNPAAASPGQASSGPASPGQASSGPASPGQASPGPASSGPVRLAAFSVTSGPGRSTMLILRKGPRFDPAALREELARHGIPALVTVGTFCRSTPAAPGGLGQVVRPSTLPDGSDVMVIDGPAMPPGTMLSIGYFSGHVRIGLIEDGARLSCGSMSGQPAARITPANTPVSRLSGQ